MAVETFTDIFISWYGHRGSVGCGEGLAVPGLAPWWTLLLCSHRFPFYYEIKMAFVLWLLSPYTRGASMLYRKFVLPVMLPSVVPRLTTDSAVRVFLGVWKLLSFLRLPSQDGAPSLPLLFLFFSFIFFLPPFEDNGLLFWVPDVLCRQSEVVLWNLLSI